MSASVTTSAAVPGGVAGAVGVTVAVGRGTGVAGGRGVAGGDDGRCDGLGDVGPPGLPADGAVVGPPTAAVGSGALPPGLVTAGDAAPTHPPRSARQAARAPPSASRARMVPPLPVLLPCLEVIVSPCWIAGSIVLPMTVDLRRWFPLGRRPVRGGELIQAVGRGSLVIVVTAATICLATNSDEIGRARP